ncbi:MAG: MFS transporter [Chitinophagales bacterium]|nr:MFS transporter [Chitinophagaceae bacterium]MCB9065183.1 MFS transporter [Chitinophagales bacterium]
MEKDKSQKKVHRGWAMYDWGNSAYNLVITSTIFPAYYIAITTNKDVVPADKVSFFGIDITNTVLQDYALAIAYLLIAIMSPILSSIADYRGNKKKYMRFFTYIGAVSCSGLFLFTSGRVELGIILFGLAAVGYCGSLVFYNAYLPEIAEEKDRDRVSALGFAYGYIGSVILQIVCLIFVLKPEMFGITDGTFPPRLSFLLVGIWWLVFAQVAFRRLPKGEPLEQHPEHNVISNGFHELKKVWQQVKSMPVLKTYLGAFFFYSMGVQTVMLVAAAFGAKELNLATDELITTILIIQLVAIAGAYIMAKLSEKYGNLSVLIAVVIIWMGVCVYAYFIQTLMEFYIIAAVVGLVMGGIQSLSRSTYSKLMPVTKDTASFFSFYDVTEKVAIVLGLFSFGLIEHITGSMRNSVLAVLVFFVIGGIILYIALSIAKKENIQASVR